MSHQWQRLGEVKYQKWTVYDMEWPVTALELEQGRCAICDLGGPIALAPSGGGQVPMRLFTSSGVPLGHIQGINVRSLASIGWMALNERDAEALAVVEQNGHVSFFTVLGKRQRKSVTLSLDNTTILQARVSRRGIAAVSTGNKVLYYSPGGVVRVLNRLPDDKQKGNVLSLSILSDDCDDPKVLVSTPVGLFGVSESQVQDYGESIESKVMQAPIVKMAVSPNGRFVACFTQSGWLCVCNANFSKTVLEFDTKAGVAPLQMVWCGDDCVVMQWNNLGLLMVGPYGDWIKFTYSDVVLLSQEIDCLRIIGATATEILQRVHPSIESIKSIGSFAPAAMLCDAAQAVDSSDPKADVSLRAIKDDKKLVEAVTECIRAACAEFDVGRQQELLKAASLGKVFCDRDDERRECATAFLLACNALRVLNVVRSRNVGLPLTAQQYEVLGAKRVVFRLSAMRFHFLARKVAAYLDLPLQARVLTEWAIAKVQNQDASVDDVDRQHAVFQFLQTKLTLVRGIRFANLARLAQRSNKRKLSSLLAHAEPVITPRILQLLRLGEYTKVLAYAILSNDSSLILFCVFACTLKTRFVDGAANKRSTFFATVAKWPIARNVFAHYLKTCKKWSMLKDFYLFCNKQREAAGTLVLEGYASETLAGRTEKLGVALEMYKQQEADAGSSITSTADTFFSRVTAEQLKLLPIQQELEKQTGKAFFVDNSLADTIFNCLILQYEKQHQHLQLEKRALRLKDDFKCSDKMYYCIKIKALALLQQWGKLRLIATEKRLPVSYLVFVQACVDAGSIEEARHYSLLIKDEKEKLHAFIKTKWWENAVNAAVKAGDTPALTLIRNLCDDDDIKLNIVQQIQNI